MIVTFDGRFATRQPDESLDVKAEQLWKLDELDLLVKGRSVVTGLAVKVVYELASDELSKARFKGNAAWGEQLLGGWKTKGDRVKDVQMKWVFVGTSTADEVICEDASSR